MSSNDTIVLFYGKTNPEFSNFYLSDFTIDGETYPSVEHYFMWEKARMFDPDGEAIKQMSNDKTPQQMKKLGRQVKNFDPQEWDDFSYDIMYKGVMAKFCQNKELKKKLLDTGDATLAEASPFDRKWGIGIGVSNPDSLDPEKWRGKNLMGELLMMVRSRLKNFEGQDFDYQLKLTATIKDGSKATGNVIIPPKIDGHNVTGIGEYAFRGNKDITSITVQSRDVSIFSGAFGDCPYLKELHIESCAYIAPCAFAGCNRLEKLHIGHAVYISQNAFQGCHNLSEVVLCAEGIDNSAFNGCKENIMFYTICGKEEENAVTRFTAAQGNQCEKLNFFVQRDRNRPSNDKLDTECRYSGDGVTISTLNDDIWATVVFDICKILRKYNSKIFRFSEGHYAATRNGGNAEEHELMKLFDMYYDWE